MSGCEEVERYADDHAESVRRADRQELWERIMLSLASGLNAGGVVIYGETARAASREQLRVQAVEVLRAIEGGPPERERE